MAAARAAIPAKVAVSGFRSAARWSCCTRGTGPSSAGKATILVVEDDPDIQAFLRSTLAAEGYRVVSSGTARRGVIDAGTHKPDLAIVDLGLPDFDGVEAIRQI